MTGRGLDWRVLGPIVLSSLVLLGLGGAAAAFLTRQQAGTADTLAENISSRRAAAALDAALADLAGLHDRRVDRVEAAQERAVRLLGSIADLADKDEERRGVEAVRRGFAAYRAAWAGPPDRRHRDAAHALRADAMPPCRDLEEYNARQIEESEGVHRQTLRRSAWGLAAVAVAGAVAGLGLGWAAARSLQRSLHALQVTVRDTASRLGPDVVVEMGAGAGLDEVHGQLQEVAREVGQVVERLRQREREVLRAEQLAAVGQLAAGVAHEVRNPLTAIKMLAQAGLESDGLSADDLRVVEREARRLEAKLNAFLDFARPPRPERSPQPLEALTDEALELVRGRAARQKVELACRRPPAAVVVDADPGLVRQVLVNLLLNALDAQPHGGRVEVEVTRRDGWAEARVADDGPGVSAAMRPRLFEPFASDKPTGLGLGLVVSRRAAEEHGGSLEGANRPAGGACFVLRLPLRDKETRRQGDKETDS